MALILQIKTAVIRRVLCETWHKYSLGQQAANLVLGQLRDAEASAHRLHDQVHVVEYVLREWLAPLTVAVDLEFPFLDQARRGAEVDTSMIGQVIDMFGQAVHSGIGG